MPMPESGDVCEFAHGDAVGGEVVFDVGDGVFAEVEDAGGEYGVGFAFAEDIDHVIEVACAAAGDDGDGDGFADGAGEGDVVTGLGAVGVHAGEEDFTGAAAADFGGPFDGVEFGGVASAVGVNGPGAVGVAFGVDGDDEALAAEGFGGFVDDVGGLHCGGVDADFVGAGEEHFAHVSDGADAAADGEGHEAGGGGAGDDVDHGFALFVGGGDVEEDEFVCALGVVDFGALHGITGVAEFEELGAFDDTAFFDVETGDDAFG